MAKAIHPSPATTTKSMLASFLFLASKKDLEKKKKLGGKKNLETHRVLEEAG